MASTTPLLPKTPEQGQVFECQEDVFTNNSKRPCIQKGPVGFYRKREEDGMWLVWQNDSCRPVPPDTLAKAPFKREQAPLTMVEACQKVGQWLDLWSTDPQVATNCFWSTDQHKGPHALHCLFCEVIAQEAHVRKLNFKSGTDVEKIMGQIGTKGLKDGNRLAYLVGIALVVGMLPQAYIWCFIRNPLDFDESTTGIFLEHCGGLFISFVSFGFAVLFWFGLNMFYKAMAGIPSMRVIIRIARQKLYTSILDKILIGKLRCVHGELATALLVFFGTILVAFVFMGMLTGNGALFTLGETLGFYVLVSAETVIGENAGNKQLRRRTLERNGWELAKAAQIDVDKVTFLHRFRSLLEHPMHADVIVMDLWLLVVMSAALPSVDADSRRLRHFVVQDAYAEFHESGAWIRNHDVAVDTFAGSVKVLNIEPTLQWKPNLKLEATSGLAWFQRGCPVPWQLVIKGSARRETQRAIWMLGVKPGSCAFKTKANAYPYWESAEADECKDRLNEMVDEAEGNISKLTQALLTKCHQMGRKEDKRAVELLLKAGAEPNDQHRLPTALFYLVHWGDFEDSARLLVEARSNLTGRVHISGKEDMTVLERARYYHNKQQNREKIIKLLQNVSHKGANIVSNCLDSHVGGANLARKDNAVASNSLESQGGMAEDVTAQHEVAEMKRQTSSCTGYAAIKQHVCSLTKQVADINELLSKKDAEMNQLQEELNMKDAEMKRQAASFQEQLNKMNAIVTELQRCSGMVVQEHGPFTFLA